MSNPLDTNSFRHFLRFISLGRTDLYEISEPIGFDAANFVLSQESKRWARSVEYGSIDKLDFVRAETIKTSTPQVVNPLGDTSEHLDFGLEWLLYIYKQYGFQSKVEYLLEKDGQYFSNGMLDFTEKDITDGYNYISTKLIQKNKVADLKRQLDTKFNLFGDKDAKNNTITPAPSVKFRRKAIPLQRTSKWKQPTAKTNNPVLPNQVGVNYARQIDSFEINDSLTPFDEEAFNVNDSMENFIFVRAKNDLTDVKLTTNPNITFIYNGNLAGNASIKLYYGIWQGTSFNPMTADFGVLFSRTLSGIPDQTITINTPMNFNFPLIERGFNFSYFWFLENNSNSGTKWIFSDSSFQIDLTETAIDTVVSGCMWFDGIKQAGKFTGNPNINAPLFDIGGTHYKNVIFNKAGVSQKTDTFTATPKLIFESVEEVNCDYEPDENEIFIGHQSDFYENVEIGVFNILPEEGSFTIQENDRHMINKTVIGYKNYQQDRSVTGTSQAIHTEAEFRFLNDNVENTFERKFDFIRDPLTHQAMVDLEISQPTTSTTDDDKVNIVEVIDMPIGTSNSFGARLAMQIIDGKLQVLNRDSDDDSQNVVINWNILGFEIGDFFQIVSGENVGNYTVSLITAQVLTLTPTGFTPTFEGDAYIKVLYYYNNVPYVTRTNEGFISNPLSLQNVRYSIKRNMEYFGQYFASCLLYVKTNIINGYFKSNGAYTSQLNTEPSPITENADVLYSGLPTPLTTARIINATCYAEFEDVLNYLEAYKTARGFVRMIDIYGNVYKAFLQKLDQTWSENRLKTIGEEKFESENLTLTYSNGILTVNDVIYNLSGVEKWWRSDNDLFKFYDNQNRPLSNYYRYNMISLNGITYTSKSQLITALLSL